MQAKISDESRALRRVVQTSSYHPQHLPETYLNILRLRRRRSRIEYYFKCTTCQPRFWNSREAIGETAPLVARIGLRTTAPSCGKSCVIAVTALSVIAVQAMSSQGNSATTLPARVRFSAKPPTFIKSVMPPSSRSRSDRSSARRRSKKATLRELASAARSIKA